MWFLVALLFVGWALSVHFYMPAWFSVVLLVGIVAALVVAMLPSPVKTSNYVFRLDNE